MHFSSVQYKIRFLYLDGFMGIGVKRLDDFLLGDFDHGRGCLVHG